MRFSWIVVLLGVGALAMFAVSEKATTAPLGHTGRPHHHVKWWAPLPTAIWLGAVLLAAWVDAP